MDNYNPLMSVKSLMACGHVSDSNYTDPDGNRAPVCGKCYSAIYSNVETRKLAKTAVSPKVLRHRIASCWIGEQPGGVPHGETNSSIELNLFRYQLSKPKDTYYCGCLERIE